MLYRDALANHASRAAFDPGVVYIGDCLYIDEHDGPLNLHRGRVHGFEDLVRVATVWRANARGHIVQPEVLFPRQLALDVGGLDVDNHRTMDYELWGKLLLAGAHFRYTHIRFAMFRLHGEQKTGQSWLQTQALVGTAVKLVARGGQPAGAAAPDSWRSCVPTSASTWRETGPLARLGLPEAVVLPLRSMQARLRRRAAHFVGRAT